MVARRDVARGAQQRRRGAEAVEREVPRPLAEARLADTDLDITDKATEVCPVGAILKKRVGYATPVGKRLYDKKPIGSDIEAKQSK